jgi:hypothetical protein
MIWESIQREGRRICSRGVARWSLALEAYAATNEKYGMALKQNNTCTAKIAHVIILIIIIIGWQVMALPGAWLVWGMQWATLSKNKSKAKKFERVGEVPAWAPLVRGAWPCVHNIADIVWSHGRFDAEIGRRKRQIFITIYHPLDNVFPLLEGGIKFKT